MVARNKRINRIKKNGFGMIEVLIAMFILVVVGVAFLITLQYAIKANSLDKAHSTAESLARSQLESIKQEAYLDLAVSVGSLNRPKITYDTISNVPSNYTVSITVEPIDPTSGVAYSILSGPPNIFTQDNELQKVTVLVTFSVGSGTVIWDASVTVEGYKVNR